MLRRLRIENLAVFEDMEVEFGPGLNVISGESGAGKTMLVRALELVLGGNADASLIGPAGDEAYVEANFDDEVPHSLADLVEPGEELTIARRLRRGGKSRSLAGGRSCSSAQLSEAGSELLSLTGQHNARRLVSASYQLDLLDRSGGLEPAATEVARAFKEWKAAERAERELREALLDGQRRLELLEREVEIYDNLEPREGEIEELEAEQRRLAAADGLRQALEQAESLLLSDGAGYELLAAAGGSLSGVAEADPDVARLAAQVEEIAEQAREAGREARDLADGMQGDEHRLEEVGGRLAALNDLRRRFRGADLVEIGERIEVSRLELAQIQGGDEELERLGEARQATEQIYLDAAAALSKKRRKAGTALGKAVAGHLADLGLAEAEFSVEVGEAAPRPQGTDEVRFLLRANRGLDPAPLDSGASGGELSRVNLALLLASHEDGLSYLFDEVDSGIGGHSAHAVADKLVSLARGSQLVVITHLAQIAVKADANFLIRKDTDDGRTIASLTPLTDKESREAEIARLVGASSDAGEAAARLLTSAGA